MEHNFSVCSGIIEDHSNNSEEYDVKFHRNKIKILQWNLCITDTQNLSVFERCPLLGGNFKKVTDFWLKVFSAIQGNSAIRDGWYWEVSLYWGKCVKKLANSIILSWFCYFVNLDELGVITLKNRLESTLKLSQRIYMVNKMSL